MNYLAHLFLSGDNPEIQLGNFAGDFFRGQAHKKLSPALAFGIDLHRKIDAYADSHPAMKASYQRLKPHIGRYASVVIDVIQDHFLSIHFNNYTNQSLDDFCISCEMNLKNKAFLLPEPLRHTLPNMVSAHWLAAYGSEYGFSQSIRNLRKKASFKAPFEKSWEFLQMDYSAYEADFKNFFPDMILFSQSELALFTK